MATTLHDGSIRGKVAACREGFNAGYLKTSQQRKAAICNIMKLIKTHESRLYQAAEKDLRKSTFEFKLTEVSMILSETQLALNELDEWMKPQSVARNFAEKLASQRIFFQHDPLGVVLVIGAWNYPLQLSLLPVVGAFAGGNTVVLKPSDLAPNMAAVLAELVPKYFKPEEFCVVTGGVDETTALLKERFDHILYTGGPRVARIVMEAAAKHLTPVTLELGGKSPCIVDSDIDVHAAAQRILWGKTMNAGQTCIAPDYVYVHASIMDKLIEELKKAREKFYGLKPQDSKDYARIVNDLHFKRVSGLLQYGKIAFGGDVDAATRYIGPTVMTDVKMDSPLMTEEIFGPVLPVLPYKDLDEVIKFVNSREKPLALYVFSRNQKIIDKVLNNTSSGGVTINDTVSHCAAENLCFGGVGQSGMGGYHGKHTFDTFTHKKGILQRSIAMEMMNDARYAPYKVENLKRLIWLLGHTPKKPWKRYVFIATSVAALALVVMKYEWVSSVVSAVRHLSGL